MTITQDQLLQAYRSIPTTLREYISAPEFGDTVEALGAKYGLHVDLTGTLAETVTYMLLGLMQPAQLAAELRAIGIAEATIAPLIADLNQAVFMPLQDKMRAGAAGVPEDEEEPEGNPAAALPTLNTVGPATPAAPAPVQAAAPAPSVQPAAAAPAAPASSVDKDSPSSILDALQPAYPKERIMQAYQTALPAVRDLFNSPETTAVVRRTRTGHRLPPDVAQNLGAQVGYVLLGLLSQQEFQNQLLLSGATPDTAQNVARELDQQVFQKGGPAVASAPVAPAPVAPMPTVQPAAPAPVATAPVPPPAPVAPHVMPAMQPAVATVAPMPPLTVPAEGAPRVEAHAIARTMQRDMDLLMHPEQAQQALVPPSQRTPARSFQTGSVPTTAPAAPRPMPTFPQAQAPSMPAPAPATAASIPVSPRPLPPIPPSPAAPQPVSAIPAAAPYVPPPAPAPASRIVPASAPMPPAPGQPGIPATPIVKQYGLDPYREAPE